MPTRDIQYSTGGLTTMVVVLFLDSGTTMVKQSDGSLIAATAANLAAAAIPALDTVRAGQYRYTIPTGTPAGTYNEVPYLKSTNGATLVQADTVAPYGPLTSAGQFSWDGTSVTSGGGSSSDTYSIQGDAVEIQD